MLDESVKAVMLSKNKNALGELANTTTLNIFREREYLKQEEFVFSVQSQTNNPALSLLLEMIRGELLLLEQPGFQTSLSTKTETNKTNFYAHEMSKLFKKCPFNGD